MNCSSARFLPVGPSRRERVRRSIVSARTVIRCAHQRRLITGKTFSSGLGVADSLTIASPLSSCCQIGLGTLASGGSMNRTPAEPFQEHTDRLFAAERNVIPDFDFGKDTAAVFDDMLDRSVPFYSEIQRMVGELAADFAGGRHADLRSRLLDRRHDSGDRRRSSPATSTSRSSGIDSSHEMLEHGGEEARREPVPRPGRAAPRRSERRPSRSRTPRSCCSC